jgi:hypothetical protein
MVHTTGVKRARPPDQAMHFIAFGKQEFREIAAILTGNTGNQSFAHLCFLFGPSPPPLPTTTYHNNGSVPDFVLA